MRGSVLKWFDRLREAGISIPGRLEYSNSDSCGSLSERYVILVDFATGCCGDWLPTEPHVRQCLLGLSRADRAHF